MFKQRVLTALVLAPIAICAVLYLPTEAFGGVIAVFFLLASWEWTRMSGLHSRAVRVLLIALNAGAMVTVWLLRDQGALIGAIFIGVAFWPFAAIWLRFYGFAAEPGIGNTGLKLLAGTLAVVPAHAALMHLHSSGGQGPLWLLFVLFVIWAADVFAYLAGSRFGKTKLAPRISPGKSIEGVYGALVGAMAIALFGAWLLGVSGIDYLWVIVLAMATVLVSIVGDLFESLIKRHAQVKDSGRLFPGHGGAYDRLDSVFAALPLFALGKSWLGL